MYVTYQTRLALVEWNKHKIIHSSVWLISPKLRTSLVKNQRFGFTMPLVTCSKVVRSCLTLFRPTAASSRLNRCRLLSSLQKRSNFDAGRLLSRHYPGGASGNGHRESDSESDSKSGSKNEFGCSEVIAIPFIFFLLLVSMRNNLICLLPCTMFESVCTCNWSFSN